MKTLTGPPIHTDQLTLTPEQWWQLKLALAVSRRACDLLEFLEYTFQRDSLVEIGKAEAILDEVRLAALDKEQTNGEA